jgi:hypothetical protein
LRGRALVSVARFGYVHLLPSICSMQRLVEWLPSLQAMLFEACPKGHADLVAFLLDQLRASGPKLQPHLKVMLNALYLAGVCGRAGLCLMLCGAILECSDLDPALASKMHRAVRVLQTSQRLGPVHVLRTLVDLHQLRLDGVTQDWRLLYGALMSDDQALMKAAGAGHELAVRFFLDCGALVLPSLVGESALSAAQAGGHDEVVRLLLATEARMRARLSSV